jgi:hypothetical protein
MQRGRNRPGTPRVCPERGREAQSGQRQPVRAIRFDFRIRPALFIFIGNSDYRRTCAAVLP